MKPLSNLSEEAKTWSDLLSIYNRLVTPSEGNEKKSFIFRGQLICKPGPKRSCTSDGSPERPLLITSFERTLCDIAGEPSSQLDKVLKNGLGNIEAWRLERGLLREFQRKCGLYLNNVPRHNDRIEWFALMQHYGAPTRLLDWTYSFYNALFMALDRPYPIDENEEMIIWGLNTDWLKKRVQAKCKLKKNEVLTTCDVWTHLDDDPHIRKEASWRDFFCGKYQFVYPVNPFRLNSRLTIQQGLFLCQGDINIPFQDNLAALQEDDGHNNEVKKEAQNNLIQIQLVLTGDERAECLRQLYRMNMTKANLYPGLQGFAESLKMRLLFPKTLG